MKGYESYKNSGVEWIDIIPSNWKIGALKHCFKFKVGFTPPTSNEKFYVDVDSNEGHDWVTIGDLNSKYIFNSKHKISDLAAESYNKDIIPKGSLLYSFKLSVGKVAFAGKDIYTNEAIFSILPDDNLELSYYYYCLPTILIHNANENIYGAKIFNQEVIKNSKLPIPTKVEQTAIASFLDYKTNLIDATIEKKKRLIALLKEKRQAVINEAVTKGLNPNAPMKNSGVESLGEIPEDWNLVPLRYLYNKIGSGVTPKGGGDVYTDEGVTFIRSQNVHFDGLRLDDVVKIDIETHQKMNNSSVEFNDVLLNITGASIGRCCVVNIEEEMNVNQHVCIIRVNERIKPDFLNVVLQSNVGQTQIKLLTTGGNREGLTQEAVKNMSIPLPNIETQIQLLNSITEKMKSFDLIKNKIETAIEKLQTYRQSLISEAVTGKIDVRNWEITKD